VAVECIINAVEHEDCEFALGAAANLRPQQATLVPVINSQ
jgi:hypothetical protein